MKWFAGVPGCWVFILLLSACSPQNEAETGPVGDIDAGAVSEGADVPEQGSTPLAGGRIEEGRFLLIGGIQQWVTLRGNDERKPLLLLVHGGPGDVQSPLIDTYMPYEEHFVVVQWDQRGAGRTYRIYGNETPDMHLDQIVADGIELAEILKQRFPDNELVVMGHSWGTVIATHMVHQRPGLFSAYVGTGQISSWAEGVHFQFELLSREARASGNEELLAMLEEIGTPDPLDARQYFSFSRNLQRNMNPPDRAWLTSLPHRFLDSPDTSEDDLELVGQGMVFSNTALIDSITRTDLAADFNSFALPYYVIQGRYDINTPTAPAEDYFARVSAPRKRMVILEDAGHFALATHRPGFIGALLEMLAL